MPQEQFDGSNFQPVSNASASLVQPSAVRFSVSGLLVGVPVALSGHPGDFVAGGNALIAISGIDPVTQAALAVRLRSTGQIWPVGFS
jgi:hypothetical protein